MTIDYIFVPLSHMPDWHVATLDPLVVNGNHILLAYPSRANFVELSCHSVFQFNLDPGQTLTLSLVNKIEDALQVQIKIIQKHEMCDESLLLSMLTMKLDQGYIILGSKERFYVLGCPITIQYISVETTTSGWHSDTPSKEPDDAPDTLAPDLVDLMSKVTLEERQFQWEKRTSFPNTKMATEAASTVYKISQLTTRLSVWSGVGDVSIVTQHGDKMNASQLEMTQRDECSPGDDSVIGKRRLVGLDEMQTLVARMVQGLVIGRPRRASLLLHGPSGCGKSSLVKSFMQSGDEYRFHQLDKNEFGNKYSSNPGSRVKQFFEKLRKSLPCILFARHLDDHFPSSEDTDDDRKLRIAFCDSLSALLSTRQFLFLATANDIAEVHKDLRSLLHREILVPLPSDSSRFSILSDLLAPLVTPSDWMVEEERLRQVAKGLFGYSAGDLHRLVDKALEICDTEARSSVASHDLEEASETFRPSGLRGLAAPVSPVRWADIGGYEEVKRTLRNCVELGLREPECFLKMGLKPPSGILLYGPPGCSKTMFARALSTECQLNMISVSGASLYSRYVGDSERAMRRILVQARAAAPVLLFIDEIDAILPNRRDADGDSNSVGERVLTELLTAMDGVEGKLDRVIVLAATNRPSRIDPALLRPGRLDKKIMIPLPDGDSRKNILHLSLSRRPALDASLLSEATLLHLTDRTAGMSGAEIVQVIDEAAQVALDRYLQTCSPGSVSGSGQLQLDMTHLEAVLSLGEWDPNRHQMEDYENWGRHLSTTK